jgi:DNA invertase Pin-like site-specific DNA recombinase
MKNAVVYARYSSAGQRDVSIADQVNVVKKYAKANKITILKVYADRAMSGTNDKRPKFQEMIEDSSKGLFSLVLIYKSDRFARNRYDSVVYKKRLSLNGVKVVSATEPIPAGEGGDVLEALYEVIAENDSKKISQNVRRGLYSNAEKAMANTMPPFGYKIDKQTRHYIIDETNAPIVKEIFSLAANNVSCKEILKKLANVGIVRSNNWLYRVLRNERYLGTYIYNDVRVENGMPQIIDKGLFHRAREFAKKRKQRPDAKRAVYLLSGKLYCGECESIMIGEYCINKQNKKYRYYVCNGKKRHTTQCKTKRISADKLERAVIKNLKEKLFTDKVIAQIAKGIADYQKENTPPAINSLEDDIKDVVKRQNNILKAIEAGVDVEATRNRLIELDNKKKALTAELDECKLENIQFKESDLINFISSYKDGSIKDAEYTKDLVHIFVTKIMVFDTKAVICYAANGANEIVFDFHNAWWTTHVPKSNIYLNAGNVFIQFAL